MGIFGFGNGKTLYYPGCARNFVSRGRFACRYSVASLVGGRHLENFVLLSLGGDRQLFGKEGFS